MRIRDLQLYWLKDLFLNIFPVIEYENNGPGSIFKRHMPGKHDEQGEEHQSQSR